MKIANSITELTGNTPLVKLNNPTKGLKAEIVVKSESFNPGSSVENRTVELIIEAAEKTGKIHKDTITVEATSGNTGISLAMVCAARGYKLAIIMPESMSKERKVLLRAFGAELILTPAAEGMGGVIAKAQALVDEHPDTYFMPRQFDNEANPQIHRETTAEEIWHDTDDKIGIFVAGVGTGGTITGVGEVLKQCNPAVQIIAAEPVASLILSGGEKGPHPIQGLGIGFVSSILNTKVYDSIIQAPNEVAFETARTMTEKEGILVGISPGAAVWSALQLVKQLENEEKLTVVLIPFYGERYLSTPLFANLARLHVGQFEKGRFRWPFL